MGVSLNESSHRSEETKSDSQTDQEGKGLEHSFYNERGAKTDMLT